MQKKARATMSRSQPDDGNEKVTVYHNTVIMTQSTALTPPKYGRRPGDMDRRAEPKVSMLSWDNKAATHIFGMIAGVVNQKPDEVWTGTSLLAALHDAGVFSVTERMGPFPEKNRKPNARRRATSLLALVAKNDQPR
jgi:hypothetical protein